MTDENAPLYLADASVNTTDSSESTIDETCPVCQEPATASAAYDPDVAAIDAVKDVVSKSSLPVCGHDRDDGGYTLYAHYPIRGISHDD